MLVVTVVDAIVDDEVAVVDIFGICLCCYFVNGIVGVALLSLLMKWCYYCSC